MGNWEEELFISRASKNQRRSWFHPRNPSRVLLHAFRVSIVVLTNEEREKARERMRVAHASHRSLGQGSGHIHIR